VSCRRPSSSGSTSCSRPSDLSGPTCHPRSSPGVRGTTARRGPATSAASGRWREANSSRRLDESFAAMTHPRRGCSRPSSRDWSAGRAPTSCARRASRGWRGATCPTATNGPRAVDLDGVRAWASEGSLGGERGAMFSDRVSTHLTKLPGHADAPRFTISPLPLPAAAVRASTRACSRAALICSKISCRRIR
jgi:hypothetical protein